MKCKSNTLTATLDKIIWLVIIWGISVISLALVACFLKILMVSAGMKTG